MKVGEESILGKLVQCTRAYTHFSSLVTLVTVTQGLFLTVDVLNGDNSNFLGNGKIPYLFIKTFHNTLFKIYPDKGGTLEMRKEKYGNGYVNTLKQEISFRGKKSNFYI